MNINVLNEKVNRLLQRTELECIVDSEGTTPSRKELIKQIAAKRGVSEKQVIVDSIKQEFGKKTSKAHVKVYESDRAAQAVESGHVLKRNETALKAEEKPAEEAAPAAEEKPIEETPAEEEKKEEE